MSLTHPPHLAMPSSSYFLNTPPHLAIPVHHISVTPRYFAKLALARLKQAGSLGGLCKHNACTMSSESAHMGSVVDGTIVLTASLQGLGKCLYDGF